VDQLLTTPYFIGKSQSKPVSLNSFLVTHRYDPTTKVRGVRYGLHGIDRLLPTPSRNSSLSSKLTSCPESGGSS
jgi:hypothetical protein